MSFIRIAPLQLGSGRQQLVNVVRCRSDGGAFQFVISGDVAAKIGLVANARAYCSLGIGSHQGTLAVSLAPNGSLGTYKAQKAGEHGNVLLSIGAAHFDGRGKRFRTVDCKFDVADDSLMIRLPSSAEISQHPSAPRGEARQAAA